MKNILDYSNFLYKIKDSYVFARSPASGGPPPAASGGPPPDASGGPPPDASGGPAPAIKQLTNENFSYKKSSYLHNKLDQ